VIEIKDRKDQVQVILEEDLPVNWRSIACYSQLQNRGSEWYGNQNKLILQIPSAVIPKEKNYVINT